MANPGQLVQELPPIERWKRYLSTRRGTVALAVLAGLASLGILLVFMSNYRDSVQAGAADTRVLVADRAIDANTSGDVIAEAGLFRTVTITDDEALEGAITDPSALEGQLVTQPIQSGQQLTTATLAPGADPVAGKLSGSQRALAVPIESAQGNLGQIGAGSRVDILGGGDGGIGLDSAGVGSGAFDLLARDVLVLKVPEGAQGGVSEDDASQVVLRVEDSEAGRIAFAASAGELWLLVRPPTLAEDSNTEGG